MKIIINYEELQRFLVHECRKLMIRNNIMIHRYAGLNVHLYLFIVPITLINKLAFSWSYMQRNNNE